MKWNETNKQHILSTDSNLMEMFIYFLYEIIKMYPVVMLCRFSKYVVSKVKIIAFKWETKITIDKL